MKSVSQFQRTSIVFSRLSGTQNKQLRNNLVKKKKQGQPPFIASVDIFYKTPTQAVSCLVPRVRLYYLRGIGALKMSGWRRPKAAGATPSTILTPHTYYGHRVEGRCGDVNLPPPNYLLQLHNLQPSFEIKIHNKSKSPGINQGLICVFY